MHWLLTTVLLLASLTPVSADDTLPSRPFELPLAIVVAPPISFDLLDYREEERLPAPGSDAPIARCSTSSNIWASPAATTTAAAHASVGFYLTVAEWGRWNFGVPSFEVGVGRYPAYDRETNRSFMKDQVTFFVSLASVHYRAGYIRAWGLNWYVNLEQVFDMKANRGGSQFGISFSTK